MTQTRTLVGFVVGLAIGLAGFVGAHDAGTYWDPANADAPKDATLIVVTDPPCAFDGSACQCVGVPEDHKSCEEPLKAPEPEKATDKPAEPEKPEEKPAEPPQVEPVK